MSSTITNNGDGGFVQGDSGDPRLTRMPGRRQKAQKPIQQKTDNTSMQPNNPNNSTPFKEKSPSSPKEPITSEHHFTQTDQGATSAKVLNKVNTAISKFLGDSKDTRLDAKSSASGELSIETVDSKDKKYTMIVTAAVIGAIAKDEIAKLESAEGDKTEAKKELEKLKGHLEKLIAQYEDKHKGKDVSVFQKISNFVFDEQYSTTQRVLRSAASRVEEAINELGGPEDPVKAEPENPVKPFPLFPKEEHTSNDTRQPSPPKGILKKPKPGTTNNVSDPNGAINEGELKNLKVIEEKNKEKIARDLGKEPSSSAPREWKKISKSN